jgi:hypothetical protein
MSNDTTAAAVAYLATVDKFTYHNSAENDSIVIEFRRAWWDNGIMDTLWYSQARDRKGNQIAAKHVTVEYAADILQRFRDFISVNYRARAGA